MAPPDPSYLTQQWSGLTHYVCPLCGYNTFDLTFFEAHRCLPMVDEPLFLTPASPSPVPESVAMAEAMPLPKDEG